MVIRLIARYMKRGALDYGLVDILRAMSAYDYSTVQHYHWQVSDLDLSMYGGGAFDRDALLLLFPELTLPADAKRAVVSGERLLERSATVHQFESGLFLRVIDSERDVHLRSDYRLWHGPAEFQATNVDMEIRCDEAAPYEIVSSDEQLIQYLQNVFALTEIE